MRNQNVQMCPYCEGFVDAMSDECHYCGSELVGRVRKEKNAAAYRPLYSQKEEGQTAVPKAKEATSIITPTIALGLFVLGSFLLTFAFLVLIFSTNGKVVLEFRSVYTIAYFFVGALAFIFGLRHLPANK